jgi:uncharacterized protein (TIGR02594 family)
MAIGPKTVLFASLCAMLFASHPAMASPHLDNAFDPDAVRRICAIGDEPPCRRLTLRGNQPSWHHAWTHDAPPRPRLRPPGIGARVPSKPDARQVDMGGNTAIVAEAKKYMGLSERSNRKTLGRWLSSTLRIRIDPGVTPWCAAFVNAILSEVGLPTSGSNLGSSFAKYGRKVSNPSPGDIVVIRTGRRGRAHVGIFVGMEMRGKRKYVRLLGGNQSNRVQISSYDARKVIAIRRPG